MGRPEDPWLARVEDADGQVYGAGTLLTGEHVLTCAHVVENAGGAAGGVRVRVSGLPDETYRATVVESCWAPASDDHRGDVAVLALDRPVPGAPRARLRRTWHGDETVRSLGFPDGADSGLWARARVFSRDFFGERVQLDPVAEPRVTAGFSGAAALTETGEIVGMVVSVRRPDAESSWMITVRTLSRYASGLIDAHLTNRPSNDPQFSRPAARVAETLNGPVRVALTRRLVSWLQSGGPGGVCAVGGGVAVPLVARLVGLTVPEYRRAAPGQTVSGAPPGTLPQLGDVDAAVDATGRTTADIASRLAESLGLPTDTGTDLADRLEELGSPVVVVVNAVDAAADPAEAFWLLRPIAERAPGIGVRLLLGYRGVPPAYIRGAVAASLVDPASPPRKRPADLATRLTRLTELAEQVTAAERRAQARYEVVAPRILGVPEQRIASAAALGIRVGMLREVDSPAGLADPAIRAWFPYELEAGEQMAGRALKRARGLAADLDALLAERDGLRTRLDAYRAEAAAHGLIEAFGDLYEAARGRLYRGLCDLRLARSDVEAYHEAVRREIDGSE